MKTTKLSIRLVLAAMLFSLSAPAAEEVLPDSEVIMQAMVEEMDRSMTLQMEDLEKPYFIAYTVDDSLTYSLSAEYGTITWFDRDRSRRFQCQVRVGSYELDNTNFSGGGGGFGGRGRRGGRGGGRTSLPLDDNYTAIRHAIWWATDSQYKRAVETLTQKQAYMKDKNLADRPDDFTRGNAEIHTAPTARLNFDRAAWEVKLKEISGRFKTFPQVQDSGVQLSLGAGNRYLVNSEGTRIRTGSPRLVLTLNAEVQAADGMRISDRHTFYGGTGEDLPAMEAILAKVDSLVADLTEAMNAPILESYMGPVLFDDIASAQVFQTMLAGNFASRRESVGARRSRGSGSFDKKLNQRILPKTFRVFDDPSVEKAGDQLLLGSYPYDDEGTPAQMVDLVEQGMVKNLLLTRTPTKAFTGSNGHARGGSANAGISNLFIEDAEGLSAEALKAALLEAAADEGLDYGLRVRKLKSLSSGPTSQRDILSLIRSMQRRGGGGEPSLGDPVVIYKVYVEDGREERVRGCEFDEVNTRDLKSILAASSEPVVYNFRSMGASGASIVAPAVLFEELELLPIEAEHENAPLLTAPLFR